MGLCCCSRGGNKSTLFTTIAGASVIMGAAVISGSGDDSDAAESAAPSADVLGRTMTTLSGEERSLDDYRGNVVLIVNTASKCGLTPQYEGLESLYASHKDDGFVILGFPANNFMGQEPGSDSEIAEFCEQNFGVSFPMFLKISVKGDDIHPLYEQLTTQPSPIGGEVRWNFQKYIVDRKGNVVAMFGPRTKPDDLELVALIETLLDEAGE